MPSRAEKENAGKTFNSTRSSSRHRSSKRTSRKPVASSASSASTSTRTAGESSATLQKLEHKMSQNDGPHYQHLSMVVPAGEVSSLTQQRTHGDDMDAELEWLERRSHTVNQVAKLRSTVRHQELKVVEFRLANERLQHELQRARSATQEAREGERAWQQQVHKEKERVRALQNESQTRDGRISLARKDHAEEIWAKDTMMRRVESERKMLRAQVDSMQTDLHTARREEQKWRAKAQALRDVVTDAQRNSKLSESKMQACAQREHALAQELQVSRVERERLKGMLSEREKETSQLMVRVQRGRDMEERVRRVEEAAFAATQTAAHNAQKSVDKRPQCADADCQTDQQSQVMEPHRQRSRVFVTTGKESSTQTIPTSPREVYNENVIDTNSSVDGLQSRSSTASQNDGAVQARDATIARMSQQLRMLRSMAHQAEHSGELVVLREQLEQTSTALTGAEWARVEAETNAQAAQEQSVQAENRLIGLKSRMDDLLEEVTEMRLQLESVEREKQELKMTPVGRVRDLGPMCRSTTRLERRVRGLCNVLEAKLEGRPLPMAELLQLQEEGDIDGDDDDDELLPSQEECEMAVKRAHECGEQVQRIKAEIGDIYAESVGDECNVQ